MNRLVVGGAHPTGDWLQRLVVGGAQPTSPGEGEESWFDGEGLVSSGAAGLDEVLPAGGYRRGTLVEFLSVADGSGAELLALLTAREACRQGGALVVLDPRGEFYPPAAFDLGIDPGRLIVVQTRRAEEGLWAWDQALRCRGVGAVIGWIEKLGDRLFRRLRLAAEKSGALGLLLRPAAFWNAPSWSEVRWLVGDPAGGLEDPASGARRGTRAPGRLLATPRGMKGGLCFPPLRERGRRLCVELLRCPRGTAGARVELSVDETTGAVHLVPQLVGATAPPAARPRPAGA